MKHSTYMEFYYGLYIIRAWQLAEDSWLYTCGTLRTFNLSLMRRQLNDIMRG